MKPAKPGHRRAVKTICASLKAKPYRKYNTRIRMWEAIVDQIADGRRYGEFSWMRAIRREIEDYIRSLSDEDRFALWDETPTAREFPAMRSLPLDGFIDALAPELHGPVLGPIHRAVARRRRAESEGETDQDD
jgi:hypothetical protein